MNNSKELQQGEKRELANLRDEDALYIANIAYTNFAPESERIEIGRDFVNYQLLGKPLLYSRSVKLYEFSVIDHIRAFLYLEKQGYSFPFLNQQQ